MNTTTVKTLQTLKVKKLHPGAILPKYQTPGAACFDLHALSGGRIKPCAGGATIDTGLAFEVPEGYVMLVYSRSGHGFKLGVRLANGVGVIDSDFRGSVMVRLINDHPCNAYDVNPGDRVAQAMLVKIDQWCLVEVDELSDTARGANGGGSTGV